MVFTRSQIKKSISILENSKAIFKAKRKKSVGRQKSNSKDVNSQNGSFVTKEINSKVFESMEISPAEIVGHDDNLMSYIIKMIPAPEERKNLRAVCRRFYYLCNAKRNYVPSMKYLNIRPPMKTFSNELKRLKQRAVAIIFGNTLFVSLPYHHRDAVEFLNENKNIIEMNKYQITTLEIDSFCIYYAKIFEKMCCFENINTITFCPFSRVPLTFKIFKKLNTLRPKTIKFVGSRQHPIAKPMGNTKKLAEMIPESVKCIHLHCYPMQIEWLYKVFEHVPERRFNTLVLSKKFLLNLPMLYDYRRKMIKLTRCFKDVQFIVDQSLEIDVLGYFIGHSRIFDVAEGTNAKIYMKMTLNKNPDIRLQTYICQLMQQNMHNEEGLLNFKYLSLRSSDTVTPLPTTYVSPFLNAAGMMKNLETLELTTKMFNFSNEMEVFISNLNLKLQNIKICDCEEMTESMVVLLSERCKEIVNISLEGVNPVVMPIQRIVKYFKNLKGLSIYYRSHDKMVTTFSEFVGGNCSPKKGITVWPNLDFLHVVFQEPTFEDKICLNEIEMGTPRKCGRFIIKHYECNDNYSTKVSEIIIQKSSTFYIDFIKQFTRPCWIRK